ncbi:CheY-like chemotaxis protein [Novosphingobium hassiacum]|uniref:CheY-like chemotaxis protein n=1 Tax=Novosphingobium hassiacum TaxID=173676 RepID=A0A7W6EXV5_9SPHN|nr:CheY-like chemotaxis protein [Novosphingobium hassiacum]
MTTPGHDRDKTGRVRPRRALGPALIVEDDSLIALDLAEALAEAGADPVLTCPSIAEAMEELSRAVPAVLVLDVHLADRDDGWALAELAMQLGEAKPLVLFTTATPDSIPESARRLGHVIAKPFRTEDLISVIYRERPAGLLDRLRGALSKPG